MTSTSVALLDRAHITGATLVGHSYGGMVIAAAADRARGRVSRLVHLDAYVPSLVQTIRLAGTTAQVPRREFIYCSGWDGTPFAELRIQLEADPEWQVHDLPTAHDALCSVHPSPYRRTASSICASVMTGRVLPARATCRATVVGWRPDGSPGSLDRRH